MSYIIEIQKIGNFLQVRAIDPVSLLEISFAAPLTAGRREIEKVATAKLDYVKRQKTNLR